MASYSDKTYTFDGLKVQYGLGLAFNMAGKYPAITKRIFDTKAMAQAFIDDKDDSAVVGLTLTVIADTAENNGVYFVKSIGNGTTAGVLEKLGSSQGTSDVKDALDKLTSTVGASEVSGLTEALKTTTYLTGATTDSVVDALTALDSALNGVQTELTKANVTSTTFNDVTATITHGTAGTSIALTADTSDVKVADDFTTTTYNTGFTAATAIATGDTISAALHKVEETNSAIIDAVLDNDGDISEIVTASGLKNDNGAISYSANTSDTYISAATSLTDADDKLDAAIKALDAKLTIGSSDKTVTTSQTATGTDLKVNIDGKTLSANTNGVISTQLSINKLTDAQISALTDSDKANIKDAYQLVDSEGTQKGSLVKIYKDSSLKSAEFVEEKPAETEGGQATKGQFLKLVYIKADGTEDTVYVDMSALISDKEFGSGVTVTTAGVVTGVVDTTSEAFLTVGANGFKLSGVANAIAAAATVVSGAADNKNTTVTSTTADDGHKIYTMTETGLTLAADKNYAKAANTVAANLEALDTQVKTNADNIAKNAITASSVNGIASTITTGADGTSIATTIKGSDVEVASSYTQVEYDESFSASTVQKVAATDKVSAAFGKVESTISALVDEVVANEATDAAAVKALATAAGTIDADEKIGYIKNTNDTYISDATSLADADDKLDAAIKGLAETVSKNELSSTAKTIDITSVNNKTNVDVNLDGKTVVADTTSGELKVQVATKATDSAVGLSTGDSGVQVALTLAPTDSAITLSQTGGSLKATLAIHADSDSTTTTGVKLSQSTDGLKAELSLDNTVASQTGEGAKNSGIGLEVQADGTVKATMYWGTF